MTNDEHDQTKTHRHEDSGSPAAEDEMQDQHRLHRRHLLKGMGAGIITTSLAGCTLFGPEERTFTAKPMGITAQTAMDLGYKTLSHLALPVERLVTEDGDEVLARIENQAVVYHSEYLPSRPPYPFAVLTTPSAEVGGEERNPFLGQSLGRLLTVGDSSGSSGDAGTEAPASVSPDFRLLGAGIPLGSDDLTLRAVTGRTDAMPSRRYQSQSDAPDSGDGDSGDGDPEGANPPIDPLAKLLGRDGLRLTRDGIVGWGIPPRLMDETTRRILGREVTATTYLGVAREHDGTPRALLLECWDATDEPWQSIRGRSAPPFGFGVNDEPPNDNMLSNLPKPVGIDPDRESQKMPGRPGNPDITISVMAPEHIDNNDELRYEVTVYNRGTDTADTVVIESTKDFNLGYPIPSTQVRTIATKGESRFTMNTNGIRAEIHDLKPGEYASVTEVIIPHLQEWRNPGQWIENQFTATVTNFPSSPDSNESNNTDSATTKVLSTEEYLRGKVTDSDGSPLSGVTVRVPKSRGTDETETTDATGTFLFEFLYGGIPEPPVIVIAEKEGYRTSSKAVNNADPEWVELTLERDDDDSSERLADWDPVAEPIEVSGTGAELVGPFDIPEGRLMVDFELEADPDDDSLIYTLVSQFWDNNLDGIYSDTDGDVPGTMALATSYRGKTSLEETATITSMGGRLKLEIKGTGGDWKLTLTPKPSPQHAIEGVVFAEDPEAGRYRRTEAEGVTVTAVSDAGDIFTTTTNALGGYRVEVFGFRTYRLHFGKPGFIPTSATVLEDRFLRVEEPVLGTVQASTVRLDRRTDG